MAKVKPLAKTSDYLLKGRNRRGDTRGVWPKGETTTREKGKHGGLLSTFRAQSMEKTCKVKRLGRSPRNQGKLQGKTAPSSSLKREAEGGVQGEGTGGRVSSARKFKGA